jgi:hypothetical protein
MGLEEVRWTHLEGLVTLDGIEYAIIYSGRLYTIKTFGSVASTPAVASAPPLATLPLGPAVETVD